MFVGIFTVCFLTAADPAYASDGLFEKLFRRNEIVNLFLADSMIGGFTNIGVIAGSGSIDTVGGTLTNNGIVRPGGAAARPGRGPRRRRRRR